MWLTSNQPGHYLILGMSEGSWDGHPEKYSTILLLAGTLKWISNVIKSTDGRDKSLKVVQYAAKLYLSISKDNPSISKNSIDRFKRMAQLLSSARKTYRLGRAFPEIADILETFSQKKVKKGLESTSEPAGSCLPFKLLFRLDLIIEMAGITTDLIDDILTLNSILSLDLPGIEKLEKTSSFLWLFTTLEALLRTNNRERTILKDGKLTFDALFCMIELLAPVGSQSAQMGQAIVGLGAALLAVTRLAKSR